MPTKATRKRPRLLSGCNHDSSTASSTTKEMTASNTKITRLPTSRLRHGCLRTRVITCAATATASAMQIANRKSMLPTKIQ